MFIEIGGKPVHIYGAKDIDEATKSQFYDAVKQPYVIQGALMPDAHKGYSLPIGGVVACRNVIVPSYVGYDLGCGCIALKMKDVGVSEIKRYSEDIFKGIYKKIPVGTNHHKENQVWDWEGKQMSDWFWENFKNRGGLRQLSSLGGGNHFCEIGYDKDGDKSVWLIIHSGSRGIGHDTGTHYMRIAGSGKVREGHYPLDENSDEGWNYIKDMEFCLEFALENRMRMSYKVVDVIEEMIGHKVDVGEIINRNHNHAERVALGSDDVWIHRKGATHAEKDMMGVIPGNMKDGTYIVRGKGNENSLCSSSHGAGRLFSRTKAKSVLNIHEFRTEMSDITAKVGKSTLDESSGAYKNIEKVMKNQKSLVDVVAHIVPIVNIKA